MAHSLPQLRQAPSLTATLMAAQQSQGPSFADAGAAMGLDEVGLPPGLFLWPGRSFQRRRPNNWLACWILSAEIAEALQAYTPPKGCWIRCLAPPSLDLCFLRDHAVRV